MQVSIKAVASADVVIGLKAAGLTEVSNAVVIVSDTIIMVESPPPLKSSPSLPPPPPLSPPPPPSPPPKVLVVKDASSSSVGGALGSAVHAMILVQIVFLILYMLSAHGDF
jgi:hypothetical protein